VFQKVFKTPKREKESAFGVPRPWKNETSSSLCHRHSRCYIRVTAAAAFLLSPPARASKALSPALHCCCRFVETHSSPRPSDAVSCIRVFTDSSRLTEAAASQLHTSFLPTSPDNLSARPPACRLPACLCPPACLPACQQAPSRSLESQGPSTQEHTHARTALPHPDREGHCTAAAAHPSCCRRCQRQNPSQTSSSKFCYHTALFPPLTLF
jgi:hypothetical protein